MITVPRSVLKRFRQLCRRGGLHNCHRDDGGPVVTFMGSADCLLIRCHSPDAAIQYRQPGPNDPETIRLSLDVLEACEGRDNSPVTIETRSDNRALLSWVDWGVPRQTEQIQPKANSMAFPPLPVTFAPNEPGLWSALHDARATTDESSTRYALGCLHLRGKFGRIEATDGHQVLVQSGYRFGFDEDLLVPASKLLGSSDMNLDEGVAIGCAEEWVGLSVGYVLILLHVQKDGRFPKIDQVLPTPEAAKSRLELSGGDARFLAETLPRLPCDDTLHNPVTFDLNGQVLVRGRETEQGRPTEVVLALSKLDGEPVMLNTNRCYVERALKLGFDRIHLFGPESPVLCVDVERQRKYLWAALDSKSAIPRTDDAIRIDSSAALPPPPTRKQKETRMTASQSGAAPAAPKTVMRTHVEPSKNVAGSPIELTLVLRDALRTAAQQANDLIRSLKRQKRQTRIVESTLASLKELQKVAG